MEPTMTQPTETRVKNEYSSPHYYLWTDALHAYALAKEALNKWDQATYVRWAINTAWGAFEMACGEALQAPGLGNRFRENLDKAIENKGLTSLDWGQGIWQKVLTVYQSRIKYVHVNANIAQADLFAPVDAADKAITILQQGIKAIYTHANQVPPAWVNINSVRGWHKVESFGNLTVIRGDFNLDDLGVIKITYVHEGKEYITTINPPGTDPDPLIEELIYGIRIPISSIRVYRGTEFWIEVKIPMRGT